MTFSKSLRWIQTKLSAVKALLGVKFPVWKQKISKLNPTLLKAWPRTLFQTDWMSKIKLYRAQLLKGFGAVGLVAAISVGGNQYVNVNMVEVYHVFVGDQEAGTVSHPQVVDDYKLARYKQIEEQNPKVHMVLNTEAVTIKSEKAFKLKSNDTATLAKLDELITAHAVGVQLIVQGKVIGIVKDKEEAEQILDRIKSKYLSNTTKDAGRVGILSKTINSQADLNPGETSVQQADFVEAVDLKQVDIDPQALMDVSDVVKKLETGDVQPTKYTIQKGDCISCIAKKFSIPRQLIYQNNPQISDDTKLQVGQQLDLTVLQPTLSVRTVEKVVENQEVQYDTDYEKDDTLRAGVVKVINPGKNGMKKVTFQVTKVNGFVTEEKMMDEQMIQPPLKALAKKGTKIIVGEGTGKFAWPVIGASISSGFGMRWGTLHKGIDFTGNQSILAADNGVVVYAGFKSDYGNHVIVDHRNGFKTLYAHLSKINVVYGKIVEKGEKIGVMGATGDADGVHLHFEIRVDDSPVNPLKYLNR